MSLLLALCLIPDARDLGHESYARREWCEQRLRSWGWLAVPELLRASLSDSPETRHRAHAMLGRWRGLTADLRAAAVLASEWEILAGELWVDEELRRRIARLAVLNGVPPDDVTWLLPEAYVQCGWFWGWTYSQKCMNALRRCRFVLGYGFAFVRLP
jgi:hypothetical protein